ncbi:MAG: hypothetical protein A3F70_06620 [Acidobacteria bacterium RIFCSPLOWO2_12_FULL_67_14]|nr:MAG: hypothetical protein A3H29_09295 [Acidobacteria bacterium RIFCSPLOWO2_02_FULL_67_21]OFW37297.1 MAG: hypothetical protein A3F70_06620 [Acidobacteria bacterium RIFCSPLOWO2_12_FULL_67_14]
MRQPALAAVAAVSTALAPALAARAQDRFADSGTASSGITTTSHAPLPGHPSLYWFVPDVSVSRPGRAGAVEPAMVRFARGVELIDKDEWAAGLPLVTGPGIGESPLADYGRFYAGIALTGLRRFEEAEAAFKAIGGGVTGYLAAAVPLRRAEVAIAAGDPDRAADILEDLSDETLRSPEEVWLRLGAAREAADDPARALAAYRRVYYGFPLSAQAADAQTAIERLETPALQAGDRFKQELDRAKALFAAGRWAQARPAFSALGRAAAGEDGRLIALRLAEIEYSLGRHRAAREALRPFVRGGEREAEARFFHLSATRGLGERESYVELVRGLVADHPSSSWSEEALNNLASYYVTEEDDVEADRAFRELAQRFPRGRYAERAAWKIGWWAYQQRRFADAAETFETAAAAFPRADYRPSWLYWSGRSRDQLSQRAAAHALYRVVGSDYLNSYYGRLATALLAERREAAPRPIVVSEPAPGAAPRVPNEAAVRALAAVELYDAALDEVEYARRAWGDSAALQATVAWIRHRRGLRPGAPDRFADVRGAITIMRRAYPQFMAAGGEQLPPDVLRVIFPLDYWPLIRKYSEAHGLDPYLMTALIAQESTFTPDVRSAANAVGLMQLIPATGRRYASKLGLRYSARLLTQPETNIRLGMRYFKDLMRRFGGAHYALASYNAGESRIARWIAERPGFSQDEFIDDIPFPETQNYVKRILGTADDYRRLYGGGILSTTSLAAR